MLSTREKYVILIILATVSFWPIFTVDYLANSANPNYYYFYSNYSNGITGTALLTTHLYYDLTAYYEPAAQYNPDYYLAEVYGSIFLFVVLWSSIVLFIIFTKGIKIKRRIIYLIIFATHFPAILIYIDLSILFFFHDLITMN